MPSPALHVGSWQRHYDNRVFTAIAHGSEFFCRSGFLCPQISANDGE